MHSILLRQTSILECGATRTVCRAILRRDDHVLSRWPCVLGIVSQCEVIALPFHGTSFSRTKPLRGNRGHVQTHFRLARTYTHIHTVLPCSSYTRHAGLDGVVVVVNRDGIVGDVLRFLHDVQCVCVIMPNPHLYAPRMNGATWWQGNRWVPNTVFNQRKLYPYILQSCEC